MDIGVEHLIDGMEGIVYMTAADGTILSIGRQNWNRFARDNDGHGLVDGNGVVGRNMFDFISGSDVRETYSKFFAAIVGGRAQRARLYSRCDSPAVKRELWIAITPIRNGSSVERLLIQSLTLSETVRPPIDLFDFKAMLEKTRKEKALPILGMCSYCQHIRYPCGSTDEDGHWIEAEDYYRRGGDADVRISHGICPSCFDQQELSLAS